jgi:hypothetical protein
VFRKAPLLLLALAAGCGSSAPPDRPHPGPAVDASPLPDSAPAPADSAPQPEPDAAPPDAAGADSLPPDAGPAPYVRTDGGPFGIAGRPPMQTCKPPVKVSQPAPMLSATGCVDPTDPKKPAASLIPYDVNSPLWSDGADKQRFLALPDGALIHVKDCKREPGLCGLVGQGGTTDDDGHFQFPVGTVLVKSFLFDGKFLETRLFVHMDDMWHGYSYQWNDAQTDAAIVGEFGMNKTITTGGMSHSWYFPARADCNECHNDTVGGSLGLDSRQLDRPYKYPSGVTADQLATLEHIGVLDAPVSRLGPLVDPRLPDPSGKNLEPRVRSYLQANCAICHRPEGQYSAIDLRYGVKLADMNLCNVDPNKGDLGVMTSKRLAPGDPARSIILLRMKAADKDSGRMPQLATSVLDPTGIGLVTSWIRSITSCP